MMTQGHVTQNCSSTEGNKYLIFIFIVFCELVSCYFFFSSYSVWGKGVKEASWLTPPVGNMLGKTSRRKGQSFSSKPSPGELGSCVLKGNVTTPKAIHLLKVTAEQSMWGQRQISENTLSRRRDRHILI